MGCSELSWVGRGGGGGGGEMWEAISSAAAAPKSILLKGWAVGAWRIGLWKQGDGGKVVWRRIALPRCRSLQIIWKNTLCCLAEGALGTGHQ